MRPQKLSAIASTVGGRLVGVDTEVRTVTVDSRIASEGSLFVALEGRRTDGHLFVHDAAGRGASAAMVASERLDDQWPIPVVAVRDPGTSLLALAAAERETLHATIVGVTGSIGKTTTKDFLAAILQLRFRTSSSPASWNNQVGLPLTILAAEPSTEILVCEIGAGIVGEIDALARVARPSIGIVTNLGLAHVETFGSMGAIARAKRELVAALPSGATAVLNAEDPVVRRFGRELPVRTVTFGRSRPADVRAEVVRLDDSGCASFSIESADGSAPVRLSVPGLHFVSNACAAAAAAVSLGCSLAECAIGLRTASLQPGRMETFTSPRGVRVVHDAYNASPESVRAGLETAAAISRRCVGVLGPMLELGSLSSEEHRKVGRLVHRLGIQRLVIVGPEAVLIADSAQRAGMSPSRVSRCHSVDEAIGAILRMTRQEDLVYVKASRAAGFDGIAEALR